MDEHGEWQRAAESIEARAKADTVKGMVARSELVHYLTKLPHQSAQCPGCAELKQRFAWVLPSATGLKPDEQIVPSAVPVSKIKQSYSGKAGASSSGHNAGGADGGLVAPVPVHAAKCQPKSGGISWKYKAKAHSKAKVVSGSSMRHAAQAAVQTEVAKGEWLWCVPKPAGGQPVLAQQSTALADYMSGLTVPLWRNMPLEKAQCHGVCVFDGHKLAALAELTVDGDAPELWSAQDLAPLGYYLDHVWRRAQEEGALLAFIQSGAKPNEFPLALLFHTGLKDINSHEAIFCVLRKMVHASDARVELLSWVKSSELGIEQHMNQFCGLPPSALKPLPPCFFDEHLVSDGSLSKSQAAECVLNKRLSLEPNVQHLVSLKARLPHDDSTKSNAQLTVELSRAIAAAHERVLHNPRDAIPVFWRDHNQLGSKGHVALLFPGSFTTADPHRAPTRFAFVVTVRKDAMQPSGFVYHVDSLVTAAIALRAARVTGKLDAGWLQEALQALTD